MTGKNLRLNSLPPKLDMGKVAGCHSTKMFCFTWESGQCLRGAALARNVNTGEACARNGITFMSALNLIYGAL